MTQLSLIENGDNSTFVRANSSNRHVYLRIPKVATSELLMMRKLKKIVNFKTPSLFRSQLLQFTRIPCVSWHRITHHKYSPQKSPYITEYVYWFYCICNATKYKLPPYNEDCIVYVYIYVIRTKPLVVWKPWIERWKPRNSVWHHRPSLPLSVSAFSLVSLSLSYSHTYREERGMCPLFTNIT